MSEASSGGHCSSATITADTIPDEGSWNCFKGSRWIQAKATRHTFSKVTRPTYFDLFYFIARVSWTVSCLIFSAVASPRQAAVVTTNVVDDSFKWNGHHRYEQKMSKAPFKRDNRNFSSTTTDINSHWGRWFCSTRRPAPIAAYWLID